MAAALSGKDLTPVILEARNSPPGSHLAEMYLLWREAICRQLNWTQGSFERRMDLAERLKQQ